MERWIKNIAGTIPHTNKTVNIELEGRNLIVTGPNGSGKTSMLKSVYDKLILYTLNKEWIDVKANEQQIELWKSYITDHLIGSDQRLMRNGKLRNFDPI
jgi:predicted ATP-binding protein involved in virulence